MASSMEIVAADADRDGKLSPKEVKALGELALQELKSFGYLTWLSTGGEGFPAAQDNRPFNAHIADPAVFVPEDWAPSSRSAGRTDGQEPGEAAQAWCEGRGQGTGASANLVYVFRYELAHPTKTLVGGVGRSRGFHPHRGRSQDAARELSASRKARHASSTKHPTVKSE